MPKILVVCGATASGKTKLSIECAKKLNTEIISADSQLIYKGLNIGTAKPSIQERQGVVHHMIDIVEPKQSFSVSDYEKQALEKIDYLFEQGKTPVICGGTGFYINSILYKLGYGNAKGNERIRAKYENILLEKGKEYIYNLLKKIDEITAQKLHVNDTKRVIRALEIYEVSGKKKSAQDDKLVPRFDYTAVAIDYPRDELYERINKRVDIMFASGLVDEVVGLLSAGINKNHQCMQAIGYKEVLECIKNGDSESTMRDIVKQNTRHYAKRQITFFKKLDGLKWIKPADATAENVVELMND